ncbi:MAG: FecR domain-containing protein, partial [Halobacteriovoraceae bacterium]|nr:FecR domain-containing protein [Halobacteriovoraceae bacterium]
MKNLTLIALSTLLLSSSVDAAAKKFYAKVTVLKGRVSQLAPGAHNASWVKKGDFLKQDTSLVTRSRSFIKVKVLGDGSNVTLGPESKLVLNKLIKSKGSVVTLLTGTIRAKINKRKDAKKKETKFYIRTQSAALGVRGTEFVVAVNQENKVTSLITLEGEVDMIKADTLRPDVKVEDEVEASLKTDQVTTVRKGRASTSYLHKEAVTVPQKVNPAQLVALQKNDSLTQEVKGQKVKTIELSEARKEELYAPDTEAEKAMETPDITTKDVSGGFVDLKSAIFIPATADGQLKVGTVDNRSGQYIPPKGVKLDVIEGFVAAANNEASRKKAEDLKKLIDYKPLPKNYAGSHGGVLTASYDPT